MPVFTYTAKDIQGEYHKGEVETVDEYQGAQLLRRKKLIVISLKPKSQNQKKLLERYLFKVSFADVVIMTRQMATMIQAGLVLSEALDILEEQQTNKRFKEVLGKISSDLKGGLDFATAIEKHPDVFPSLYSKLVRAGQASGKLDTILLELASNLEKERSFKSKVRGAMIYPIVVITMMFAVMLIMVFFVMPKLMSLYSESGIDLPLPTKIMLGVAGLALNFWWAGIILGILAVMGTKRFLATPSGRMLFDRTMLKVPVIGKVTTLVIMTNFTRTFGLLIASGLSMLEAIRIVGNIVGNSAYKESFDIAYKGVERGLTFSSQLIALPVFPRIVGQMIKTGEETGKLDDIMFRLADYFESEADNALKNITTLIEPIILVVLGLGVALLVVSIILPIYQLTTNVR